jgi:hypothetical protein
MQESMKYSPLTNAFETYKSSILTADQKLLDLLMTDDIKISNDTYSEWYAFFQTQNNTLSSLLPNPFIMSILNRLVKDAAPNTVVDPWTYSGFLLELASEGSTAQTKIGNAEFSYHQTLTRLVAKTARVDSLESLLFLRTQVENFDVIVSIPPFLYKKTKDSNFSATDGSKITLTDYYGHLIIAAATQKLQSLGVGIFIVPESFFLRNTIYDRFAELGISVEGAFALPRDTFGNTTQIQTYLIITRNALIEKTFVAELSNDAMTNGLVIDNFQHQVNTKSVVTGVYVPARDFRNIQNIKALEEIRKFEVKRGYKATKLGNYTLGEDAVKIVSNGQKLESESIENVIYIPLIGFRDVIQSIDSMEMKPQNYAKVVLIDDTRTTDFIVKFLNSPLGKQIRQLAVTGTIPKLNKSSISELAVFVPNASKQKQIINTANNLGNLQNILKSLTNELVTLQERLWTNETLSKDDLKVLEKIDSKLNGELKEVGDQSLFDWAETLPFPLASILRSWRATPSQNWNDKNRILIHFFEATAMFSGIFFLSAFCKYRKFDEHQKKLLGILKANNLSIKLATFGVWKNVIEYYGKITREMLKTVDSAKNDYSKEELSADEVFPDFSKSLASVLSSIEFLQWVNQSNKLRNTIQGHGGLPNPQYAEQLHGKLVTELENLRSCYGGIWSEYRLVRMYSCMPDSGMFEHEVADMTGSNNEFIRRTVKLSEYLDRKDLYIISDNCLKPIKLLPFLVMAPPPENFSQTTCYFYSSNKNNSARYVSYHLNETPEIELSIEALNSALQLFIQDVTNERI